MKDYLWRADGYYVRMSETDSAECFQAFTPAMARRIVEWHNEAVEKAVEAERRRLESLE